MAHLKHQRFLEPSSREMLPTVEPSAILLSSADGKALLWVIAAISPKNQKRPKNTATNESATERCKLRLTFLD